jgi:hypothetical protein
MPEAKSRDIDAGHLASFFWHLTSEPHTLGVLSTERLG